MEAAGKKQQRQIHHARHTWEKELNPNLDDVYFQALLARGAEWAATGTVTLRPDLGWETLYNGTNFDGWEVRGPGLWTVIDNGVLLAACGESPI